ncbi:MAG: T9SS type A sorting domain-containing protein [Candidatus Latescibacteria bacterium]|nr:T9SS type A sorting domain-containing protein [Candidatus Latescibacterota bacterium]
MQSRILLSTFFSCLALGATALAAQEDYSPGTFQLTPQIDLGLQPTQLIVPNQYLSKAPGYELNTPRPFFFNLPPGFRIRLFAASRHLRKARFMAFSPDGVLHVASMGRYSLEETNSAIMAFPDRDDDGVADAAIVVADGFKLAHSLAFHQDALYVAEADQITRLIDADGDGIYEQRAVLIADIPALGHHTTRTIVIDPVNEKLFVGVGSPCDLCRPEKPFRGSTLEALPPSPEWGTVLQFNLDGSGRRVWATGMRNPVGLTLHPSTNQLWGTHNGHDREGAHLPPEWIDVIGEGDFMGYPFVFGYQVPVDSRVGLYRDVGIWPLTRADSLAIGRQKRPAALVPAHLAPMGIHFYTGDHFPTQFRYAAFVALRGGQTKGNLAVVPGFKVVALFSEADGANAQIADFLTGFGSDPQGSQVWGKPVGISQDAQGRLYVTSDQVIDAVYRIEAGPFLGGLEHNLPDTVASGNRFSLQATVRLSRFDASGPAPVLWADLSALGGPENQLLTAVDDSLFQLDIPLEIERPVGRYPWLVRAEQGDEVLEFKRQTVVLPGDDIALVAGGVAPGWRLEVGGGAALLESAADRPGLSLAVEPASYGVNWTVDFIADRPVETLGYKSLQLAFHPGDSQIPKISALVVTVDGLTVDLLHDSDSPGLDLEARAWQVIEIPLETFALQYGPSVGARSQFSRKERLGQVGRVQLAGNIAGTIYLDDMRLLTEKRSATAVVEGGAATGDLVPGLEQNYPNPFNSDTVIRFALPQAGSADLAVYNLAGQKVAQLLAGPRPAGAHVISWDGRDQTGRALASGVYLYRLQVGQQVQTRKLLLLR